MTTADDGKNYQTALDKVGTPIPSKNAFEPQRKVEKFDPERLIEAGAIIHVDMNSFVDDSDYALFLGVCVYDDRKRWQKELTFDLNVQLYDLHPREPFASRYGIIQHDATIPLPECVDWICSVGGKMIAGSGRRLRARSGAGAAAASRKKRNGKHGAFQAAIGVIHAGEPSGRPFFLS